MNHPYPSEAARPNPVARGARHHAAASALTALVALAGALGMAGCGSQVVNPVTGRSERSVMDTRAEIEEGRKAHQQILQQQPPLANPRLQAYVNEVGQKLARNSHRADLQWTFTVLDSPEVNAFALPGGYVYITRGILPYLDSEADMAGVIGHEIGHVTARHGAQRATRQQDAGLGVLGATILGAVLESRGVGGAGQMLGQASQALAAGHIASYSREQELEADKLGAEYLARVGYNPQNMVDVIQVLKAQDQFADDRARASGQAARSSGNDWLSSHPASDERLQRIREAEQAFRGRTGWGDDNRARYVQAIDGIPYGDSADQGFVRGQRFVHPALGIALTAPAGWTIQNQADAVVLVAPQKDAGLIVRMVPAQAGRTDEDVLRNAYKATQGRVEPMQLNGMPATRFSGARSGEQGQQVPLNVTLVQGPKGNRYALQWAGAEAAQARAQGGLREAEASFRAAGTGDLSAARPWRLRATTLPAGGFAELARRSPLGAEGEARLRLINGVYGASTELRAGTPVKTIVEG